MNNTTPRVAQNVPPAQGDEPTSRPLRTLFAIVGMLIVAVGGIALGYMDGEVKCVQLDGPTNVNAGEYARARFEVIDYRVTG